MSTTRQRLAILGIVVVSALPATAEDSLEDQMKVQRACEAAIWGMPAVGIYDIELSIQRDLEGEFGDVVYFSKPMTSLPM